MQGIDHLKHIISEILPNDPNSINIDEVKKLSIAIVGKQTRVNLLYSTL